MNRLLQDIAACIVCQAHLPHTPRPVLQASPQARILIIGQAPGAKVHQSGIPWQDQSGNELRRWLGVSSDQFYDSSLFALVPMGFCYPGKGTSGDLPPRPECAPLWHEKLLTAMPHIQLTILIGMYAQNRYLGKESMANVTENVRNFRKYMPRYMPLVHPSPRNKIWHKKNPWFETEVLPELRKTVQML